MKIGIIADTHSRRATLLSQPLIEAFAGVNLILHAGDICDMDYIKALGSIADVVAVAGNNDGDILEDFFGKKVILEVAGQRIGVVHGHEGRGRTTLLRAFNTFANDEVDMIVFGHSHELYFGEYQAVTMINPGSVSRPRGTDRRPSVVVLEINGPDIAYQVFRWEK